MKRTALDDPRYYLNRHVQWLEFNRRVLEEARDIGNPLLERVKFLAITANNLDEFVEIRVSSFLQRIEHGSRETSPDGLTDRGGTRQSFRGDARFGAGSRPMLERRIASGARETIDPRADSRRAGRQSREGREDFLRPPSESDADAGDRRSVAPVSRTF